MSVQSLLVHWPFIPIRKASGLRRSWGVSWPLSGGSCVKRGLSGSQALDPLHDLEEPSRLRLYSPSSKLFLSRLTALGCGSSLGSGSRMQTRRLRCLVPNPKRMLLRVPPSGPQVVNTLWEGSQSQRTVPKRKGAVLSCSLSAPVPV